VLDGVYAGPDGIEGPTDGPVGAVTLLLLGVLLEVRSALEGWMKPGMVKVKLIPVGRVAALEDGRPDDPE
jgi:hypothetical protein